MTNKTKTIFKSDNFKIELNQIFYYGPKREHYNIKIFFKNKLLYEDKNKINFYKNKNEFVKEIAKEHINNYFKITQMIIAKDNIKQCYEIGTRGKTRFYYKNLKQRFKKNTELFKWTHILQNI